MDFKLFQTDVKNDFLNRLIQEEVYVDQPHGFKIFEYRNHVYKLKKALYGFKQAPRAWYELLCKFLIEMGFIRDKVDTTLFIKKKKNDLLLVQIYIDDITFSATNESLCKDLSKLMKSVFQMPMMGELMLFLGLQIKQTTHDIFIHQTNVVDNYQKGLEWKVLNTLQLLWPQHTA